MTSTTETISVTRELEIEASPEAVWEFLVDPEKMIRWMGLSASLEQRAGGAYRVGVVPGHTASGTVATIERPRRLVLTWGWEPVEGEPPPAVPPGSSTVELELFAEGAGTRLVLTHRDLPSGEAADSHTRGWEHYLPRLVTVAAGGDPGRDPWLDPEA